MPYKEDIFLQTCYIDNLEKSVEYFWLRNICSIREAILTLREGLKIRINMDESPTFVGAYIDSEIVGASRLLKYPSKERQLIAKLPIYSKPFFGFNGIYVKEGYRKSDGVVINEYLTIADYLIALRRTIALKYGCEWAFTTARIGPSSRLYDKLENMNFLEQIKDAGHDKNVYISHFKK